MEGDERHCAVCGFPVEPGAGTCACCGYDPRSGAALHDEPTRPVYPGPSEADYADLGAVFADWRRGDDWRAIVGCLSALQIGRVPMIERPDGPSWVFMRGTAAIYLRLHKARRELHVESPILRLAASQRVPMMRSLLEVGEQLRCGIRPCLRGDVVLLRFWDRMPRLSPPRLLEVVREIALAAGTLDDLLSLTFGARVLGPDAEDADFDVSFLGRPIEMTALAAEVDRRETRLERDPSLVTPAPTPRRGPSSGAAALRPPPRSPSPPGVGASPVPHPSRRAPSLESFRAAPAPTMPPLERAEDLEKLCRFLSQGAALAAHIGRDPNVSVSLLVATHRASLYQAWASFGRRLPRPLSHLFFASRLDFVSPPDPQPTPGRAAELRQQEASYAQMVEALVRVEGRVTTDPDRPPPIAARSVGAHVRILLRVADEARHAQLARHLLRGVVSELIVRGAGSPEALAGALREERAMDDAAAVRRLRGAVEVLA